MSHSSRESGDSYGESSVQNLSENRANDSLARIYATHIREHTHYLERYISQLKIEKSTKGKIQSTK